MRSEHRALTEGFGVHNLPFGVFSTGSDAPRVGVAFGEHVIDVGGLDLPGAEALRASTLNPFMALGRPAWDAFRVALQALLRSHPAAVAPHRVPREEVRIHLPFHVADYVDFYSSQHHAENLGRILRPGTPPLTPNWKHLPIGYHGRAGTVAVSGTPVVRPSGQRQGEDGPVFAPSTRLDVEAEVGFVVGVGSSTPVSVADFEDHVFGVCLVNDWSARDMQAWETAPLGPFLGKSFLTSVSPWVVPLAALSAARRPAPPRDVELLPYLRDDDHPWALDITLQVRLNGELISSPPFAQLYWTPAQQLAHLTSNGASVRTGDLFASGTVSGQAQDQRGSLIELSSNGAEPLMLGDGTSRSFLEDGDEVTITATAPGADGSLIDFGTVRGRVQPVAG